MNYRTLLLSALLTSVTAASVAGSKEENHIPQKNVGDFIVSSLDLASFRNSLGPRRQSGAHTFSDLGMLPSSRSEDDVVFESDDWYYRVRVLERGDFNEDGIEDLKICFQDRAKVGTYNVQEPLLVSRYDPKGYLVALAYELTETPGCSRIHQ